MALDASNVPPVEDDENLTRFMLSKDDFRGDQTVKPRLFVPYKFVDLSVTRLRELSDDEVWAIGCDVAAQRSKTLRGRCEITAKQCKVESLIVVEKPLAENPNHADITGYPAEKQAQMALAQELAARASKRIPPPDDSSDPKSEAP